MTMQSVKNKLIRPEYAFSVLSAIFGLVFLFIIPPLQTPDEVVHFLKAYELSEGKIIPHKVKGVTGDELPRSVGQTIDILQSPKPIKHQPELKYDLGNIKAALKIKNNKNDRVFYDLSVTALISPVGYIPQAMAFAFSSHILQLPTVVGLYAARLFILIAWIILGHITIRLMPYKKWAIFGILLFPMFIAQSVAIGVDAISIGVSAVFVASILHALHHNKLTRKIIIIIAVSAVIMVLSKQIAAILLPLVLLLRKSMFSSRLLQYGYKASVIAMPILMFILWVGAVGTVGTNSTPINNENPSAQVAHLINSPPHLLGILFNTFFFAWGNGIFQSLVGVFGWMDTPLSEGFIAFGYAVLAVLLLVNYREAEKVEITRSIRVIFTGVAVLYSVAVCIAMYILYSPVGFNIVVGVQGRYLLPTLILLIPVLYGFATTSKRKYVTLTAVSVSILFLASVVTIVFRYYIDYRY